ncbi:unnamed protein product [Rhodiola kirilowii]
MAGWTMVPDETADGCGKVKQKVEVDEFWVDLCVEACKVRDLFDRLVRVVLEDFVSGSCIRPLPPKLGDGKCVDLFRVFIAVRERGGFEMVTDCGLWNLIGESCGLGCGVGVPLKLIYVKYLDVLERIVERKSSKGGLRKCSDERSRMLSDLEHDLRYLLSDIADEKKKDTESSILNFLKNSDSATVSIKKEKKTTVNADEDAEAVECMMCTSEVMDVESGASENPNESSLNLDCKSESEVPNVQVDSNGSKAEITKEPDDEVNKCMYGADDGSMIQSSTNNEGSTSQKKRKRESLSGMMHWLIQTAKNPCDPATGCLPERSKWKSYGNDVPWKQVLSAREELFFKQKFDSKADHEFWLRRLMLPSMYEGRTPERPRSSRKPTLAKKSQLQNEVRELSQSESDYDESRDRRLPRIGKKYQADLPKWDSSASESDFKWLGTKIWPLEKTEKRKFFERVPIGRGRQDDCGCATPGSVKCVRFHISEKSARLKPELGSAFHYWRFDCMGENVAGNWTAKEEKEFQYIVKEYHNFRELWDKLREAFPTKSRAAFVSYYFNVFLLRHRADQNRSTPDHIDSDIEELEPKDNSASKVVDRATENSRSSIYYSPKKQKKGTR